MQPTLEHRLLLILKQEGGRSHSSSIFDREKGEQLAYKGFWPRVEASTGIKMSRWRSFFIGHQGARSDMIEAAARVWPQYAFWLVTGITDAANGHTAPVTALTFPERLYAEDFKATAYFRESLELLKTLDAEVDGPQAIERNVVLGRWFGSELVGEAYKLASSDAYQQLQELWNSREEDRKLHVARITGAHRPWLERKKSPRPEGSQITPDPRIEHQDDWDLFYKPKQEEK